MEQKGKIEKFLEVASHPPVDWDRKIDELAKKVKKIEQLIIKEK